MKSFNQKPAKVCAQSVNNSALSDLKYVFQSVRTKADVLRAVLHEEVLRRIPIEQAPSVSKEQAEKDFRRERVILNGVFFIPDKVDVVRCEAFALSLHHLVERLQMQEGSRAASSSSSSSSSSRSMNISDTILQRGCRTSAGADSFFMVQKLLCVEGTFVTQKTSLRAEDPIIVDVFLMHEEVDDSGASSAESSSSSTNSTIDHRSEASHSSRCSCEQCCDNKKEKQKVNEMEKDCQKEREKDSENLKDNPVVDTSRLGQKGDGGDVISDSSGYQDVSDYPVNEANNNMNNSSSNINSHSILSPPEMVRTRSSLFARIEVKNFFSVYDISAMDEIPFMPEPLINPGCGGGSGASSASTPMVMEQPMPWLEVQTILIDESNFRTKEHWRRIQLIVTEMPGQPPPSSGASSPSPLSTYSMSCMSP